MVLAGRSSDNAKAAHVAGDEKLFSHKAANLGWCIIAFAAPAAFLLLIITGMRLTASGLLPLGLSFALLVAVNIRYSRFAPNLRISLAAGTLAMVIGGGTIAGIISHIGLRLQRPLIDAWLLKLDQSVLIDTPVLVVAFGGRPMLVEILNVAYASAVPLCVATIIYQSVIGQAVRAWEAAATFSFCIIFASIAGAMFPAIGNIAHAGINPIKAGLPGGAGIYHLSVFDALYNGQAKTFDIRQLTGIVTFPSFHLVMALIPVWSVRESTLVALPTAAWGLLVAFSTVPIGGHYVVDLIAGLALWGGAVIAIGAFARWEYPSQAIPYRKRAALGRGASAKAKAV